MNVMQQCADSGDYLIFHGYEIKKYQRPHQRKSVLPMVSEKRFCVNQAKELKESGTNPTKTEVDVAIGQIIAMEESAAKQHDLEDGEKQDKMEGDRLKAEEMRRTAMETMGRTQKRKSEEGQSKAKKCRRSGSETVEFLKLKAEQDMGVKKQELQLRKQEQVQLVEAQNQQRDMFKQMIKQQQKQMHDMQSFLMLQQQQQTTALMKIIERLVPK
ncbi:mRNA export factor GLE1-like [Acropora muricata]|uniref:mRNA export factor GLE1-like n=1 Tax=Acropora muricata TaxID=159855 RepID=UPI0034E3FCA7